MTTIPSNMTGRRALTVDEFCKAYSLSKPTCYKLIRSGELHSVIVGGRRLIPVDSAEALLRQPSRPLGPPRRAKREAQS